MRRIITKEARPGMVAARKVTATQAGQEVLIAQGGELLGLEHLVRFHEMGLYDLWVNDPGLEFLDVICAQPTTAQMRLAEGLRDSFLRLSGFVPRMLFKRHALVLEEVVQAVIRSAAAVPMLGAFAEDEPLLAHSCDVAALAILLGLQLEGYLVEQRRRLHCREARDVVNLALGALFHDVGELMMPAAQRESRQPLLDGQEWKQHTAEGYQMVRGRMDPSAAGIVLHHHQRFDGTGFAGPAPSSTVRPGFSEAGHRALSGGAIHVYARIVMAADVFCQVLFAGARLPQPLVKALWQLQRMPLAKAFDPVVFGSLLGTFVPFADGMVVMLNDGRQALVVGADAGHACYPKVRVLRGETREIVEAIDLARSEEVRIEVVDGTVVEGYLYGGRQVAPLAA